MNMEIEFEFFGFTRLLSSCDLIALLWAISWLEIYISTIYYCIYIYILYTPYTFVYILYSWYEAWRWDQHCYMICISTLLLTMAKCPWSHLHQQWMRRLVVLDCCHKNLYSRVDHLMIWVTCSKVSPYEFRIIFFPSWGLLYLYYATIKLLNSVLMYLFSDCLWPANSNKSHGFIAAVPRLGGEFYERSHGDGCADAWW